ncbi:MAG: RNA-processing protein [Methanocorpusculum sp.]|nr:RNA-processing protein [Methanocorpusculum sp.]
MNWYGTAGTYSLSADEGAKRVAGGETGTLCSWLDLKTAGLVSSRDEYIAAVRETAIKMAEDGIAAALSEKDVQLLQMVRMLDEMDNVINHLTERISEWYQSTTPGSSRKYSRANSQRLLQKLGKSEIPAMRSTAREILSLATLRSTMMKEVSREADSVIPNMSALVGGLVAARLVSRAGGLEAAAKMAGSSIQVLGAESALFSHIRTGSSSPKHGLIFQHRRVHNAPREVRGHVARMLAAKLAIAARLDYYRGELAPEFIADANEKIDRLMKEGEDHA